jgi:hypothetical protein
MAKLQDFSLTLHDVTFASVDDLRKQISTATESKEFAETVQSALKHIEDRKNGGVRAECTIRHEDGKTVAECKVVAEYRF